MTAARTAILRDSTESDVAAIAAIYAHHVRNGLGSFEEEPPAVEEMSRRRAAVVANGLPYLVAETAAGVVGYAYAAPYRARIGYRFSLEDSVYVAPSAGRRGIGRSLLGELIARSTVLGYRQMVAVIGDTGNVGSIGLHRALGFRLVGTLAAIGFKHGRWVDSVLMQRSLGLGDRTLP